MGNCKQVTYILLVDLYLLWWGNKEYTVVNIFFNVLDHFRIDHWYVLLHTPFPSQLIKISIVDICLAYFKRMLRRCPIVKMEFLCFLSPFRLHRDEQTITLQSMRNIITARQRSCGKVMFSVMSVSSSQLFCPQRSPMGSSALMHWSSLYRDPPLVPSPPLEGTSQGSPVSEIWWPSLETSSNLFTSWLLPPVLTPGDLWRTDVWCKWVVGILLERFLIFYHFIRYKPSISFSLHINVIC